jgi:hypothetical protein
MLKLVASAASQLSVVPSPELIVAAAAVKAWILGGAGGTDGFVTVTTDSANLLVFAMLVARTLYVPSFLGAVNTPSWVMSPPVEVQMTDVSLAPATAAVKACVPNRGSVTAAGSSPTVTSEPFPPEPPPGPGSQPNRASRGSVSTRALKVRHIMGLRSSRGTHARGRVPTLLSYVFPV